MKYGLIKGGEFYNIPFKKWLKDNNRNVLKYDEGKSVVAERFIRTLKKRYI